MRIGIGYDVHKFAENRDLILGGVKIPYERGLMGHSDADVLTHSIIDAMLGALALGNIGTFFPDTEAKYKNIDSFILLEKVLDLIKEKNYKISNLDSSIIAQEPKLNPHIKLIRNNLAKKLNIELDQISVKATTSEYLGFIGRKEGIAVHTVALLNK